MTKKQLYDNHHIVGRSRGGSNHPDNLVNLQREYHERIHRLFQNMTPKEQIDQLLTINQTALRRSIVRDLKEILEADDECWYKDTVRYKQNGVYRK